MRTGAKMMTQTLAPPPMPHGNTSRIGRLRAMSGSLAHTSPRAVVRKLRALPPAVWLVVAAHGLFALFAAVLLTAMAMPEQGLRVLPDDEAVIVKFPNGQLWHLRADTPLTLHVGKQNVTMAAGTLLADYAPAGDRDAVQRFYANHDTMVALLRQPGVHISGLVAGRQMNESLVTRSRTLPDLSLDFWLLCLQAMVIGLIGVWIRAQAPRDLAAWFFGLSADGVVMAAFSGAVFDARGLAADGTLLQVMQGLNFIGTNISSVSLFALFLFAPRALVRPWCGFAMLVIAVLAGILEGLALLPLASFYVLLLGPTVSLPFLCLLQYRKARGDPKGRAVLRWVGATTFVTTALVSGGMAVPVLLNIPSLASDGMTIFPLFIIYGGIAFGVGGFHLFELDRWTYRLVLGGGAAMVLLAFDGVLVNLLRLEQPVALAIALLAIGYGYFPLRAALWQIIAGGRPLSGELLFRQAALVGFIAEGPARRRAWRELLDRVFEPLDIAAAHEAVSDPALAEDGVAMLLPALAGETALRLQFARRGSKLFGRDQLNTARELVSLLAAADKARAEYTRGVSEERQRIARDLHDDVSGLLLTGLHRREVGEAHGDIRNALTEIRTMVSSLAGRTQQLATVLGDLRYECASRLTGTGISLDWPADAGPGDDDCRLGYAHHKVLTSALREMVTNVIRHSEAGLLTVRHRMDEGWFELTMADDGKGWTPGKPQDFLGGHGLGNVAHRLGQIGGTCCILPVRRGFCLQLRLPLPV